MKIIFVLDSGEMLQISGNNLTVETLTKLPSSRKKPAGDLSPDDGVSDAVRAREPISSKDQVALKKEKRSYTKRENEPGKKLTMEQRSEIECMKEDGFTTYNIAKTMRLSERVVKKYLKSL